MELTGAGKMGKCGETRELRGKKMTGGAIKSEGREAWEESRQTGQLTKEARRRKDLPLVAPSPLSS